MTKLLALSLLILGIQAPNVQAASTSKELRLNIDNLIESAWFRQDLMREPRTPTHRTYRMTSSIPYMRWVRHHWEKVNHEATHRFQNPPHYQEFMCIHSHEGSWQDNGSPYYGGLQMDYGFQRSYGRGLLASKGTADHWTPLEQIWVAERAYFSGRGFHPWPNTARYCGLI